MFTRNGSPRPSYGYSQKEHTLSHGDDCGCEACADTSLPSIYSADTTVDTLPELDAPGFDSIESRDTEEEEAEAIVLGRGEALLGNVDGWDLPAPRTPLRTVQAGHEDQYPQDRFVQSSWIDKLDSARDEDMGLRANVRESVLSPLQPHSFGARPYALAIAHASTEVHPPTSALKLRTQPSGHVPSQERAAMMPPLSENGKGHDKNSRQHGPSAYDLPLLYAPGEMDSHRARTPAGFPLSPAVGTPDSLVVRPTQTRDAQPPSPALLSPSTPVRGLRKRRSSAQLAQISPAARSSRVRISVRRPALTLRLPTARGPDESRLGEGGNGLLHSPHTPTRARLSPARRLPSQKERAEMVEKQR